MTIILNSNALFSCFPAVSMHKRSFSRFHAVGRFINSCHRIKFAEWKELVNWQAQAKHNRRLLAYIEEVSLKQQLPEIKDQTEWPEKRVKIKNKTIHTQSIVLIKKQRVDRLVMKNWDWKDQRRRKKDSTINKQTCRQAAHHMMWEIPLSIIIHL